MIRSLRIAVSAGVCAFVAGVLVLSGCVIMEPGRAPDTVTAAEFGSPQVWGGADNVVKVRHLYFSEQPDVATLEEARANGVGVLINVRVPSEQDWDEAGAAQDAGLAYYNVPLSKEGDGFERAAIERIGAVVRQHHDEKILLHCSSGNRAAGWLAIHLAQDHGMEPDAAISLARGAGLTKPVIEERVRHYLETEQ